MLPPNSVAIRHTKKSGEKGVVAIQKLRSTAANPKAYSRQWKQATGGRVVGTLCSYAPKS
jgi:translation initiation factor 1 (eIF-1/SUI1)